MIYSFWYLWFFFTICHITLKTSLTSCILHPCKIHIWMFKRVLYENANNSIVSWKIKDSWRKVMFSLLLVKLFALPVFNLQFHFYYLLILFSQLANWKCSVWLLYLDYRRSVEEFGTNDEFCVALTTIFASYKQFGSWQLWSSARRNSCLGLLQPQVFSQTAV